MSWFITPSLTFIISVKSQSVSKLYFHIFWHNPQNKTKKQKNQVLLFSFVTTFYTYLPSKQKNALENRHLGEKNSHITQRYYSQFKQHFTHEKSKNDSLFSHNVVKWTWRYSKFDSRNGNEIKMPTWKLS